jgi:diaminopimelate epimerase
MGLFNSDGSSARACGNGTRCVAKIEMDARGVDQLIIQSPAAYLKATRDGALVTIDMGDAHLDWASIPLARAMDTLLVDVGIAGLPPAVAVNMGNPHAVFFVDDVENFAVATFGLQVEKNSLFPDRANVEFVQVLSRTALRMRVWERGAGITQACGSGACAAMVAAKRRGLCDSKVDVYLDGGVLTIQWLQIGADKNHVLMTGPTSFSFTGLIADELLHYTK